MDKLVDLPLNQIVCGDCLDILKAFPDESIACVVTDPPYGIGFMGKNWDQALPDRAVFIELFRVMKSGALAFIMSSPRQDVLWRMLALLEGCGFQLNQSFVSWIYKSGMPKAYDLSLGIDKKFIREEFIAEHGRKPTREELKKLLKEKRKVVGERSAGIATGLDNRNFEQGKRDKKYNAKTFFPITKPYHKLAKEWVGYKSITGLKPALECILMVHKPMSEKTIVDNVLKHGVGAVNVDACRIPYEKGGTIADNPLLRKETGAKINYGIDANPTSFCLKKQEGQMNINSKGRFPANLLVSDGALDNGKITRSVKSKKVHEEYGDSFKFGGGISTPDNQYDDSGGASRFFDLDAWAKHHGFLDVAKASKAERNMGLKKLPKRTLDAHDDPARIKAEYDKPIQARQNFHPTVKPVKLMAYLIELGCPPEGIVLDPFVGSGTTCISAHLLNRKWIGIDINPEYVKIAKNRLAALDKKLPQFFS